MSNTQLEIRIEQISNKLTEDEYTIRAYRNDKHLLSLVCMIDPIQGFRIKIWNYSNPPYYAIRQRLTGPAYISESPNSLLQSWYCSDKKVQPFQFLLDNPRKHQILKYLAKDLNHAHVILELEKNHIIQLDDVVRENAQAALALQ